MNQETSRERIRKALRHEPTEQLPIDFGSSGSTGLSVFSYENLKQFTGLDAGMKTEVYDLWLMQARPSMQMLERFGGDIIQVPHRAPAFGLSRERMKQFPFHGIEMLVPEAFSPRTTENGSLEIVENGRVIGRMPNKGFYFDMVDHPYSELEEVSEIDALQIKPMSDEDIAYLGRMAKTLYEMTDKSLMYYYPRKIFEDGIQNWGFENFLIQLVSNEEMIHRYFERITDVYLYDIKRILDQIGPYIDIFRFVDDLGTQINTLISKTCYEQMIKPYQKKVYRSVKEYAPQVHVALHSCGAIRPFLPDLIECGVEVLNPVQISAAGMNPKELKEEFGKDLVFWGGGANMQFTAVNGTIEEIKEEVRSLIEIFRKDSGFIFAPVHAIQANVRPEVILAIYETALSFRSK